MTRLLSSWRSRQRSSSHNARWSQVHKLPSPASPHANRSWNRGEEHECTFRTESREQSRRLLSRWPHTADSGTARTPLTVRVADSYCSHETQQYYLIYTQFNTILYNVTRAHVLSGLRDRDSPCATLLQYWTNQWSRVLNCVPRARGTLGRAPTRQRAHNF